MRELKKVPISQAGFEYGAIFYSAFQYWAEEGNCPSEVYYGYDENQLVGFFSGFPLGKQLWYLQRCGFTKEQQHKLKNLERARWAINEIHKEWLYILTLVRNDDQLAIKFAIALSFKIIGVRMDVGSQLWVEMIREREVE